MPPIVLRPFRRAARPAPSLRVALAVAALALIVACASAEAARPAAAPSPEDGARTFYAKVVRLRIRGLPDATQLREIAPAISSPLARALRDAAGAERRHRKATGNREPPLWQGDVFSSLFEGPTEASVDRCQIEGDHAQCIASLSFRDAFGGSHRWSDRAIMVRERGRWVVDDVSYEARWAFGNKGTLRANLADVVARAPAEKGSGATAGGKGSRARGR